MGERRTTEQVKKQMGTPMFFAVLIVVMGIVITGAIFLGKSDSGQIDVTAAIQNSNQANTDANGDARNNVGTIPDALRNMPNGGLVPQGEGGNTAPAPEPVVTEIGSTTASSTETGTTTETATEGQSDTSVEGDTETEAEADVPVPETET